MRKNEYEIEDPKSERATKKIEIPGRAGTRKARILK